jgi:large subunit ribosomal protein L21
MVKVEKAVFDKYAIIQTGGKQYQALPGKTVEIEKIEGEIGAVINFDQVLFRKNGENEFEFGKPFINGAVIKAKIVKQIKGPKVVVFKFKRRNKYRTKKGHRQQYTIVRIESV